MDHSGVTGLATAVIPKHHCETVWLERKLLVRGKSINILKPSHREYADGLILNSLRRFELSKPSAARGRLGFFKQGPSNLLMVLLIKRFSGSNSGKNLLLPLGPRLHPKQYVLVGCHLCTP